MLDDVLCSISESEAVILVKRNSFLFLAMLRSCISPIVTTLRQPNSWSKIHPFHWHYSIRRLLQIAGVRIKFMRNGIGIVKRLTFNSDAKGARSDITV